MSARTPSVGRFVRLGGGEGESGTEADESGKREGLNRPHTTEPRKQQDPQ